MRTGILIKAIFFDLDETLISRAGAIRAFIADQFHRYAAELEGIDRYEYVGRFLAMEDNGRIPKDMLYPAFVAELNITGIGADALLRDYRRVYPKFASPNPGALQTVERARAAGLSVGVVTNGNAEVQHAKLSSIGIEKLLDAVIISEAVGLRKPDPKIFELAASELAVELEATLFVGDNPEVDIVGAAGAGMRTAWFRNGEVWPKDLTPKADIDIEKLAEVLPYCGV